MTLLLVLACSSPPEPPEPVEAEVDEAPLLSEAPAGAQLDTYREMWADRRAERASSDGGGAFVREGDEAVQAGTSGRFVLRYTAGPEGVAVGGALTFVPEPFWGWSPPQVTAPERPGYVEVSAPEGVGLEARAAQGQLVLEVAGRALASGETVGLVYGPARVDRFAEPESGLYLGVDGDGDGVRAWVRPAPTVEVTAGPARQLVATLPSTAAVGEVLRLTVAALDAGANAGALGIDRVELTLPEGWSGPEEVVLHDGVGEAQVTPSAEGIGRVQVTAGERSALAGPVLVRSGAPRILWGDLQIHTGRSDGTGTPTTAYRYARDVAGLDVAAVTDHDRFGMHYLDAEPALWAEAQRVADEVTTEAFVAIPAYEWTNWVFGHRHVLYPGEVGPVFSSLDPATDEPAELWEALRPFGAISIPHHPGGGPVPVDWSRGVDAELEPVIEVVSVHGQSESSSMPGVIYDAHPASFVAGVLSSGVRAGLIGSTDGHDGHPGLAHLVGQGNGGLVALIDAERSREGVASALRERRVYATNGVRTFVNLRCGDEPMGSEQAAGEVVIDLRVVATAPVLGLELVGKDGVVERKAEAGPVVHETWSGSVEAGDYRYVRMVQADGGMVWTSPCWFD